MLILDELAFVTEMIQKKDYGTGYVKLKTLVLLAKYFCFLGKDTKEIKKLLREICKIVDLSWNETTQEWKIKLSINESKKRRIRQSVPIPITKKELENIRSLNNQELERISFVYLVYGKFLKYNNTKIKSSKKPRQIGIFYVNEKAQIIFEKAGVNVRKKQRSDMLHNLFSLGILDATKYGGVILKFTDESSPTEFMVENYDDIPIYYRRWRGEQVVGCACGRLFLKKSNNDSLCHKCKQNKRREEWRERQKRHREQELMSRKDIDI